MKQAITITKMFWLTLFLILIISGCATRSGNFATFKPSWEVKKTFENFEVNPDYTYFHYGPKSFPRAVVGISKKYRLDSTLWQKIDLTSKDLRTWIWAYANRKTGNLGRYGSTLIDENGRQIGIWYSLEDWKQWARIEVLDDDRIRISSPVDGNNALRFQRLK